MTKVERFKRVEALNTALRRGSEVLAAITKYEKDKNRQGLFLQLDHETYRTLVNVCFPEIEQEVLDLLKPRYNQLMITWVHELRNLQGEVLG